jgi:hypothetical protein
MSERFDAVCPISFLKKALLSTPLHNARYLYTKVGTLQWRCEQCGWGYINDAIFSSQIVEEMRKDVESRGVREEAQSDQSGGDSPEGGASVTGGSEDNEH